MGSPVPFRNVCLPDSGSLDGTHRATVDASAAIRTGCSIDHMFVALLADGINRAGIRTSCTIDALVVDCVSHDTFLLEFFVVGSFRKLSGEVYINNCSLSRVNPRLRFRHFLPKYLQFCFPSATIHNAFYKSNTAKNLKIYSLQCDYKF